MKPEQVPVEAGPGPEKVERMLAKEEQVLSAVGKSLRLGEIFKTISRSVASSLPEFKTTANSR